MDYRITITAQSPLSFSEHKPGGVFIDSVGYVPGSTLRGALAGLLLSHTPCGNKHPECERECPADRATCPFYQIFLGANAAVFTNAYPAKEGETPRVLPTTASTCKVHPGFGGDAHGVRDLLLDYICWEALKPAALTMAWNCPQCSNPLKRMAGFYVCNAGRYRQHPVNQKLLTRVAINRRRMVAEEGMLYSPFVLSETTLDKDSESDKLRPTTFVGCIHASELANFDWSQELASITALGGRISRGLGSVSITVAAVQGQDDLAARIKQLNAALQTRWGIYQGLGDNGAACTGTYFTVGLQADAVLRTYEGLPTMVYDEKMLERDTQIDAELVRSFASYTYRGGWNAGHRLPKPAEVVTKMGSVYVFRVADDLTPAQMEKLAALERRGIGERCAEGFGQVRVADEFHYEKMYSLEKIEEVKNHG